MTFARRTSTRKPQPLYARVERRGTYAAPAPAAAIAKPEAQRNPHLLAMARGQHCLLRAPKIVCAPRETTVACHSNRPEHGKAAARKADDQYTVWGCFACHTWLDQGRADGNTKALTFMRAHVDQVLEWRAIAADLTQPARDRLAAQWALDRLNATPIGMGSTEAFAAEAAQAFHGRKES